MFWYPFPDFLIPRYRLYALAEVPFLNNLYSLYFKHFFISYDFPRRLGIEITDLCNLNCSFCPSARTEKTGNINLALVEQIAQETSRCRFPVEFTLHKMGEPFLNKEIWQIIEVIKRLKKSAKIFIATNGFFLKDNAKKLVTSGVDFLKISFSSAYDSGDKNKSYVEKEEMVSEGVMEIIAEKIKLKKKRPRIIVQFIKFSGSDNLIVSLKKKWSQQPVLVDISFEENWAGFLPVTSQTKNILRYPCLYLWLQLQINVDGSVSACPTDWNKKLIVGDLRDSSIKKIWQGEKQASLREHHLNGDFAGCELCNSWQLFPNLFKKKGSRWEL